MPTARTRDRHLLAAGVTGLAGGAAISLLSLWTAVLTFVAPWRTCMAGGMPTSCAAHPHDVALMDGTVVGVLVGLVVMGIGFGVLPPVLVRATDPTRLTTPAASA